MFDFFLDVDPLALHSQNWDVPDMSREYKVLVSVATKKYQKSLQFYPMAV